MPKSKLTALKISNIELSETLRNALDPNNPFAISPRYLLPCSHAITVCVSGRINGEPFSPECWGPAVVNCFAVVPTEVANIPIGSVRGAIVHIHATASIDHRNENVTIHCTPSLFVRMVPVPDAFDASGQSMFHFNIPNSYTLSLSDPNGREILEIIITAARQKILPPVFS